MTDDEQETRSREADIPAGRDWLGEALHAWGNLTSAQREAFLRHIEAYT